MKRLSFAIALAALVLAGCEKSGGNDPYKDLEWMVYEPSEEATVNPERGFYYPFEIHQPGREPSASAIASQRLLGRTLVLLEFYITDYMEGPIADDYLQTIRNAFKAVRDGGGKAIVRFAYKNNEAASNKPWDPEEAVVMQHIDQVGPIMRDNADVIYVVQAGFVGVWGEWYYTDHFVMSPKTEADYQPRKHVLDKLLSYLPADRQVEVRTPAFKMKIYGLSLADTLTREKAHQDTPQARIASHNDCFVASDTDYGTFSNSIERNFWKADTRYTIMGGETCAISPFCKCTNTLKEMTAYHFSYLNSGYHQGVMGGWKTDGCYPEIERRLGYRLVATDAWYSPDPKAGKDMRVVVKLTNEGFAAPMNPRLCKLILTDADGKVLSESAVDTDPRYWMPAEEIILDTRIAVPESASGEVSVWLALPDAADSLKDNPLYSVRLSNKMKWDEKLGANRLFRTEVK